MIITDQDLQAFIDGELAPEDAARVEAAIAGDVLVAARVERERRLRAQLRGAFDPVLQEPVPQRLAALIDDARAARAGADVVRLDERRTDAPRRARWRTPVIAMAASLAALALAGWLRAPSGDIVTRGDVLVARGGLAKGLDTGLAGAPDPVAKVAVGLTFRNAAGEVCRTFHAGAERIDGLACRDGRQWRVEALSRNPRGPAGELRQAASAMPAEIAAAVDARMQGDAFDATQERAARASGWR